jgi:hypothetical protein
MAVKKNAAGEVTFCGKREVASVATRAPRSDTPTVKDQIAQMAMKLVI